MEYGFDKKGEYCFTVTNKDGSQYAEARVVLPRPCPHCGKDTREDKEPKEVK